MPELFLSKFQNLVPSYLEEKWAPEDGIDPEELASLLQEAGVEIPQALREFYMAVGNCPELTEVHHFFWDPDELEIDSEGFLMFLEDASEEYTWGMPAKDVSLPDPLVYRRRGEKGRWESEDGTFSEFVLDHFQWVFEEDER